MNLISSALKAGHQASLSRRPQPQRELQGEVHKSASPRTAALRPKPHLLLPLHFAAFTHAHQMQNAKQDGRAEFGADRMLARSVPRLRDSLTSSTSLKCCQCPQFTYRIAEVGDCADQPHVAEQALALHRAGVTPGDLPQPSLWCSAPHS